MHTGALTSYFDVAQVTLYAFWIFFAGLIFYLRREDKREGYPLVVDRPRERGGPIEGFPFVPKPKTFLLQDGSTKLAPSPHEQQPQANVRPSGSWPGAPLVPTGNPMIDAVGPASYATSRRDVVEMASEDGKPKLAPLRVAPLFSMAPEDPDPCGMGVYGADGVFAGTITDIWVDRTELTIRYLEMSVAHGVGTRSVLLPMTLARVNRRARRIKVQTILGSQFVDVPPLKNPDQITALEEDKITAYYGGGQFYATPERAEPFL